MNLSIYFFKCHFHFNIYEGHSGTKKVQMQHLNINTLEGCQYIKPKPMQPVPKCYTNYSIASNLHYHKILTEFY